LPITSRLRLLYLCYFSKPVFDRPIYRAIRRCHARKIVEVGVGDGRRAVRMIEVAHRASPTMDVHYVGMDPFETRSEPDGRGLSLKAAHQLLSGKRGRHSSPAGVRVQLVPGNPADGLIRMANSLGKIDLLIVPAEFDSAVHARLWYFVPRMLHERSLVFIEASMPDGQRSLRLKPRGEIDQLAWLASGRRVA
jgi:hypothetical protein